ncbi:hypothetical protein ACFYNZ_31130 [Streptomyces kebangsaanensis]|uniref:Uncharacterized protein n=1 Tax=Streptomyces kebangsaanensis TaxID=864058 RepID=A0ABW6L586_9ACTN
MEQDGLLELEPHLLGPLAGSGWTVTPLVVVARVSSSGPTTRIFCAAAA